MKKFRFCRFSLLAALIMFAMVHLPCAVSVSKGMGTPLIFFKSPGVISATPKENESASMTMLYDSLNLHSMGLSVQAFEYAAKGYSYLKSQGKLLNTKVLSIIDFTLPSSKKRLFIIDVENYRLLFNTYVAHGQNTGEEYASKFSNKPDSYQSSLGFYLTSGTYMGKNGFSLQLDGLEYGINNNASERAIVMHGAPYVSEGFINNRGYIGRSHGCPAVPEKMNRPIIERIKNGSCLFIYGKDSNYMNRSKILNT
jgi:L,D-transpeptidase catalytic domain